MSEIARITLNNLSLIEVNADPTSGVPAKIGSLAMNNSAGTLWKKTGSGDTVWTNPNATPVVSRLVDATTVTSVSSVDITGFTTGNLYRIHFWNYKPVVDATDIRIRTSSDGGATYDASAGNYAFVVGSCNTTSSLGALANNSANRINITNQGVSNTTPFAFCAGVINFVAAASTVEHKPFSSTVIYRASGGNMFATKGLGRRISASIVDAIRIFPETGDIDTITYSVTMIRIN